MYWFFRDHGINDVGFNVEEKERIDTSSSMAGSNLKAKYKDFLRTLGVIASKTVIPLFCANLSR